MSPTPPPNQPDGSFVERRKLHRVYPPLYEVLRPFFDRRTQWGHHGSQEHLAYLTLKENYPDMSAQDIFVTVVTARRLFHTGAEAP